MFKKLIFYAFPLSILIYYILPFFLLDPNFKSFSLLIFMVISYFLGTRFPFKFSGELKSLINNQKRNSYIFLLGVILFIIYIINNGGISNIFSGNFRNWYYYVNNQWEGGLFYKINQIIGMFSLFFCSYCGWLDGEKKKISKNSILWVSLNVIPRLMINSRLFFLGILIYAFSYFVSSNKKFKLGYIICYSIIIFILLNFSLSLRFDGSDIDMSTMILSSFNGIENLSFVLENIYSDFFNFEFFLYHWTPLPGVLFTIPETNLTVLKYGTAYGSSEPMPLIASIVYLQGRFSIIYTFLLGSVVSGVIKQWDTNKTFINFFIMLNIIYMVLIYHNHSNWRANSRVLIILIWFKIFLSFDPLFGKKSNTRPL